jgi:hypothetical protein
MGRALDEGERHRTGAERGTSSGPLSPWGYWILRWFAAMLAVIYLSLGIHLAVEAGRPATVLLLGMWLPALALFAGGMTIVAAGLRWALARFAPPALRHDGVAVAVLGALAGPLALLSLFATGDPAILGQPGAALDGVVAPLALGGGVAAHLAERQVRLSGPRWWLLVLAAVTAGLVLGTLR